MLYIPKLICKQCKRLRPTARDFSIFAFPKQIMVQRWNRCDFPDWKYLPYAAPALSWPRFLLSGIDHQSCMFTSMTSSLPSESFMHFLPFEWKYPPTIGWWVQNVGQIRVYGKWWIFWTAILPMKAMTWYGRHSTRQFQFRTCEWWKREYPLSPSQSSHIVREWMGCPPKRRSYFGSLKPFLSGEPRIPRLNKWWTTVEIWRFHPASANAFNSISLERKGSMIIRTTWAGGTKTSYMQLITNLWITKSGDMFQESGMFVECLFFWIMQGGPKNKL